MSSRASQEATPGLGPWAVRPVTRCHGEQDSECQDTAGSAEWRWDPFRRTLCKGIPKASDVCIVFDLERSPPEMEGNKETIAACAHIHPKGCPWDGKAFDVQPGREVQSAQRMQSWGVPRSAAGGGFRSRLDDPLRARRSQTGTGFTQQVWEAKTGYVSTIPAGGN